MSTSVADQKKTDTFERKMIDILNKRSLVLMTSIGSQTGLFDTMGKLSPSTSEAIAVATDLNERYVREWLGAMVTGKIVDYDSLHRTYWLPPEHARMLTHGSKGEHWAEHAQFLSSLATVEQQVVECFRSGGGVPHSAFLHIHAAEGNTDRQDELFLEKTLPIVPDLVRRLTAGIEVADIGCGNGHRTNLLARTFPSSRFVGYDIDSAGIAQGTEEAMRSSSANSRFETRDVATLDVEDGFDLIMAFDAIHMQAQLHVVLLNIARALRRDGAFLMVDFAASSDLEGNMDHPLAPFMYTQSCLHCLTLSRALGGEGPGAMWGEENARTALHEAGFASTEVAQIESDIFHICYVARFTQENVRR